MACVHEAFGFVLMHFENNFHIVPKIEHVGVINLGLSIF